MRLYAFISLSYECLIAMVKLLSRIVPVLFTRYCSAWNTSSGPASMLRPIVRLVLSHKIGMKIMDGNGSWFVLVACVVALTKLRCQRTKGEAV